MEKQTVNGRGMLSQEHAQGLDSAGVLIIGGGLHRSRSGLIPKHQHQHPPHRALQNYGTKQQQASHTSNASAGASVMIPSRNGSFSGVAEMAATSRVSMDRPMPASEGPKPVMDEIRESLSQWAHDEHANPDERDLRIYLADDIARSVEEALPSQGDNWLRSSVQTDIALPDLSRFKIDVSNARPEPEPAEAAHAAQGVVRLADVPRVSSRSGIYIQNRIAALTILSRLLGPDNTEQRSPMYPEQVADIMGFYQERLNYQTASLVALIEQLPDENERLQLLFQLTTRLSSLGVRCVGGPLEDASMVAAGESMDKYVLPAAERLGVMQLQAANNLKERLINAMYYPVKFYREAAQAQ